MVENRVAVVTGGSRGMGRCFVDALVAAGMSVACLARPSSELDAVAAETGGRVLAVPCDVSDHAQVGSAIQATIAQFGRIDVLVDNAAIFHPFRVEEASVAQVEAHVGVNLLGPIWCIRACIPYLRRTKGQIVSVSSESVRLPFPYFGIYAATKGGLEVLSAAMRDELREDGIRVTVLRSGSVSGSSGGRDWDAQTTAAFYETIQRSGHSAFTGAAASPQSMANSLLAVLSLPVDVNVDLIEVRGAASAEKG